MKPTTVGTRLFFFAAFAANAPTPASPSSFEAASVKPLAPSVDGMVMRRLVGGPGSTDPVRITYSNVTLKILLTIAYNLKNFQVEGPYGIDNQGYDIVPKLPPGTTQEQLAQIFQTFLAERFHVVVHRETRELSAPALTVAKAGPNMKTVKVPAVADASAAVPGAARSGLRGGPEGAPGPLTSGPGIRISMGPDGAQMAGYLTMAQLANQLTRRMDRPVLDQTELTGTYDVNMTWTPDEMGGGGARRGSMAGRPGNGGTAASWSGNEPGLTLLQAPQATRGLKLQPRKSEAEIVIVDRADKAPVEN